jgi:hypothetical protein
MPREQMYGTKTMWNMMRSKRILYESVLLQAGEFVLLNEKESEPTNLLISSTEWFVEDPGPVINTDTLSINIAMILVVVPQQFQAVSTARMLRSGKCETIQFSATVVVTLCWNHGNHLNLKIVGREPYRRVFEAGKNS